MKEDVDRRTIMKKANTSQLTYFGSPLAEALEDFLLPNPRIPRPPPPLPPSLPFVEAAEVVTTSGLEPFRDAKSWKLIGGAEALRGLLLEW